MPSERFDLAFVDTWRDAGDGAPMYKRMKSLEHLSPKTEFLYWIENFLKSNIRSEYISGLLDKDINELDYKKIVDFLENPIFKVNGNIWVAIKTTNKNLWFLNIG